MTLSKIEFRGFILCVDIVGSTAKHFAADHEGINEVMCLARRIQEIIVPVLLVGGRMLTFRGDGYLAIIPQRDQPTRAAADALHTCILRLKQLALPSQGEQAVSAPESVFSPDSRRLRVAVHYGKTTAMNHGPLARQFLGRDLVIAARLCDWMKDPRAHNCVVTATEAAVENLGIDQPVLQSLKIAERVELNGIGGTRDVFNISNLT